MDGSAVEALGDPRPVPRSWLRFVIRAGVVLGCAAGAWIFGAFVASAATPDPSPPRPTGGVLRSIDDAADALLSPMPSAGDGAAAPIPGRADALTAGGEEAGTNGGLDPRAVAAAALSTDLMIHHSDGSAAAPVGGVAIPVGAVARPNPAGDDSTTAPSPVGKAEPAATAHTAVPAQTPTATPGPASRATAGTDAVAATIKTSVRPVTSVVRSASAAESSITDTVNHIVGFAGLSDRPVPTLITPATGVIHAVLAPVAPVDDFRRLTLTPVAKTIGETLTLAAHRWELPVDAGGLHARMLLADPADDAPGPSSSSARQVRGADGAARIADGGSNRAAFDGPGHGAPGSPCCYVMGDGARHDAKRGPETKPAPAVEQVHHAVSAAPGNADDAVPTPMPGRPAPLPAAPPGAPASGAASAINNGYDCVAIIDRARAAIAERSTAGDAVLRALALDHARDPGFSPG